ncbi:MAG: PA14 domain-containing protein, partial [Minisyncoccia bacterium]
MNATNALIDTIRKITTVVGWLSLGFLLVGTVGVTTAQAASHTASLAINGGTSGATYSVGTPWTLTLTTNIPNSTFTMCGTQNGGPSCTPNWGVTDGNGNWTQSQNFATSTVGDWIEWIQFPDGTQSNQITFTVVPAVPYQTPPDACSEVVVSDTTNLVNGQLAALAATPYNPLWTASIPGAAWIWETPYVTDPIHEETVTFTKDFVVTGNLVSAELDIAADNSYNATLNGITVASDSGIWNFLLENQKHIDALSAVHQGTNHFVFTVTNVSQAGGTIYSNPAGLLYKLDVEETLCGGTPTSTPTSSTPGTLVIVTNVTNDNIGVKTASDFTDNVTGTNVTPTSTFAGSATGVTVMMEAGPYSVAQAPSAGYLVSYSSGCSGTIAAGETRTCTVSDDDKPLPPPLCSMNGLYGTYNNLPANHPDVQGGAILGDVSGTTPFQYDWYAAKYFSFATSTPIASFNQPSDFFPANDGLPLDPFYTAIHWTGYATFPASGTYPVNLGSDDDSWLYINGHLVDAVPGIHPITYAASTYTATSSGTATVDLYFAERYTVQSALVFQMPGVTFSPCAPPAPTSTPTSTIPSADIAIAKTADVTSTIEGGTMHYTLTVTALGPATSTGVTATDTLPS